MKKFRIAAVGSLAVIAALLVAVFVPGVAQAQEGPYDATIAEIALENEGFSILVEALVAADLVDVFASPGSYTVFAPTNEAFVTALNTLGITADELFANKELLTSVLLYHVAAGELFAADVLAAGEVTMLDGNTAAISVMDGNAYINNARIDRTDIWASNGVIHVIDQVILPPTFGAEEPAMKEMPMGPYDATIAEIALQNKGFSVLVDALVAADLVDVFANPGSYTVFAPTNEAFVAALDSLGITADELFANKELLTSVLLYHVAAGELFAADVLAAGEVTMLDGNTAEIRVKDGEVFINGARIDRVDIWTSNGVIHVIQGVLLPPAS